MREFVDTYPRGVGELAGDVQSLRGWTRASPIDRGAFGYRDGMVFLGRGAAGALLGLDDPGHCVTVAGSRRSRRIGASAAPVVEYRPTSAAHRQPVMTDKP